MCQRREKKRSETTTTCVLPTYGHPSKVWYLRDNVIDLTALVVITTVLLRDDATKTAQRLALFTRLQFDAALGSNDKRHPPSTLMSFVLHASALRRSVNIAGRNKESDHTGSKKISAVCGWSVSLADIVLNPCLAFLCLISTAPFHEGNSKSQIMP